MTQVEYTYPQGALRDGTSPTVVAFALDNVAGLLVTPVYMMQPTPKPQAKAWTITHAGTGNKVCNSSARLTRRNALEVIEKIGRVYDWSKPMKELSDVVAAKDALVQAGLFEYVRSL